MAVVVEESRSSLRYDASSALAAEQSVAGDYVSLADLTARTQKRPFGTAPSGICVVGVISSAPSDLRKAGAHGKQHYVFWRVSDLCNNLINVFLLTTAQHVALLPTLTVGAVILIASPTLLRPTERTGCAGVLVDNMDALRVLGTSVDYAICATESEKCSTIIDRRRGASCDYHILSDFKISQARRMEFATNDAPFYVSQAAKPTKLADIRKQQSGDAAYLLEDGQVVDTYAHKRSAAKSAAQIKASNRFIAKKAAEEGELSAKYLRSVRGLESGKDAKGAPATKAVHATPEYKAASELVQSIKACTQKRVLLRSAKPASKRPKPEPPRQASEAKEEEGDEDVELQFI